MIALFAASILTTVGASNVQYINPFVGTDNVFEGNGNYAGMIPTVGSPFAMTRWTAMTRENYVGDCPYIYTDKYIHGFLATHQPAQWMGESAEIAFSAGVGEVKPAFKDRGNLYSHDDEVSSPHYYKAILQSPTGERFTAEISATSRAGIMRFTFDESSTLAPFVIVQATREKINGEVNIDINKREIYGYNPERQDDVLGPFTATDFKGYFVAQFDQDFESYGTTVNNTSEMLEMATFGEGSELAAFVRFAASVKTVNVRVGVSYISYEQARANLDNEISSSMTLEDTAAVVEAQWAEKVDSVQITNATYDDLVIFYTSMYHALQYPSEMMEHNASGTYYYSGYDNTVHQGDYAYTGYSIWDTFRSEWAFINLFAPERVDGMIVAMLQMYQEGGRLPIWMNIVETNIMIGTHASSLIAESLAKGFRNFDLDIAWEALYKDAMVPPNDDLTTMYYDREEGTDCEARAGLTRELELGYVAALLTSEAGSRTLEYAYDDYTVAVAAELLGHTDDASYFHERSRNYRNIFNTETMFMEARYENGSWCNNPTTWTEADNWVYTFNVQHDFAGLRDLFQGPEALGAKLDAYYQGGHNDQTNEPSHATVYAYLYANEPAKMQSMIRSLLSDNYFNSPVGISGNDDCGQMSSWYIFNAMGFYPMNPASGEYIIGSPIFDEVRVKFPMAKNQITISASGAKDNMYVSSLVIDGAVIETPVLKHSELLVSSSFVFTLSSEPQLWGTNVV